MKIEQKDIIKADCDLVYTLVKDHLEDIATYLPNIKKIEQIERNKISHKSHHILNYWYAKVDLPFFLRKFISKDLFMWKDRAVWCDKTKVVKYEIESFYGNDLFRASGENSFVSYDGGYTELRLSCDFEINAEKIPGLPLMMKNKIVPLVEDLIKKMLSPNLLSLSEGIKSYIKNH